MGLFSSGNKWKRRAQVALEKAQAIEDYQRDVEFQRGLLSNIRQQRIAQAQMSVMGYSDSFSSSTAAGASANIDSALAGETDYAYGASQRAEDIQGYRQTAQEYMKKYAKQQKTRAAAFAITGALVGGAVGLVGAVGAGASILSKAGAAAFTSGATIGQGIGQMTSNTGQFDTGFQNILSGFGQIGYSKTLFKTPQTYAPGLFVAESISPQTGKPIEKSQQHYYQTPNGQLKPVTGGFFS